MKIIILMGSPNWISSTGLLAESFIRSGAGVSAWTGAALILCSTDFHADLKRLIVPLFLEQLLVMLVGIADTFMVSSSRATQRFPACRSSICSRRSSSMFLRR